MSKNRKDRRAEQKAAPSAGSSSVVTEILTNALKAHEAGQLVEAEKLYRQALQIEPKNADGLHLLGVLAYEVGGHDIAIDLINQAIAVRSDLPYFYNSLGNAYLKKEDVDTAIKHYRHALSLKPDYAEGLNNMGTALKNKGDAENALIYFKQALELEPNSAEVLNNIGTVLGMQEKPAEAMAYCRRAIALNPRLAEAHLNIGGMLRESGELLEAITSFRQAIYLKPDYVDAYINLGVCLGEQDKFDESILCHEKALAFKPNNIDLMNNIAGAYKAQGKLEEAIDLWKRVISIEPGKPYFHGNLLLAMLYAASAPPDELATAARHFNTVLAGPLRRNRPFVNEIDSERELRIGYVSPDFRNHAVNYFFEPLLKAHNRENFKFFGYSNTKREDLVTERLKKEFDYWRDIRKLDDDEASDLIEADKIDILVDLTGHTGHSRLLIFARKPAPIQVAWLGFPATTGMSAMDYRITDSYAEPPGMTEHLNTETLWRLPEIFCCYQAHEKSPAVIDHPPFEDNGYITFGCFNNFSKVTDDVLKTWASILANVPDSRLLLEIAGIGEEKFLTSIKERLQQAGLPLEQVILEPRSPANQFVLYNKIDIALDPFPCAGGTTSMDTVWMGVPFITLAGKHFVSRMGVTILTNCGMPELIAQTQEEYIHLATELALDKDRLRSLRHGLRERVAASPLMNQKAFARNMEAAYREMWRKYCASSN